MDKIKKEKIKLFISGLIIVLCIITPIILYALSDDCPTDICKTDNYVEGLFPWIIRQIKELIN